MSDVINERAIDDAVRKAVDSAIALDNEQFARFVGLVMSQMTFVESTVLAMVRALPVTDFLDFCDMVPGACNKVSAERRTY